MINFQNVTKIFKPELFNQPFVALNDVSFTIPEGSMVGFLGANGAGKTTSLKIIMDFIRPTAGNIEFSKSLGTDRQEIFKNIGFLPERPYFYQNLRGEEFLHFMGELSGVERSQINTEINKWAARFKIDHALKREIKTYSKGMLQRIGFLATILHQPKLIILDEPLSGLDPIGRKELKDVIVEVHKSGKTVFFSSHIVSDIEEICDRVIFLKEGKLVYDGPVNSLMFSADRDYRFIVKTPKEFRPEVTVKSKVELPDSLTKYVVSAEVKDSFLKDIVGSGGSVFEVEMVKPSLEEIFYQTQGR